MIGKGGIMNKAKQSVKFNLTEDMFLELIKFNEIKHQLFEYEKKLIDNGDDEFLLQEIEDIKEKLNSSRKKFIFEFQKNNKEEINTYLNRSD